MNQHIINSANFFGLALASFVAQEIVTKPRTVGALILVEFIFLGLMIHEGVTAVYQSQRKLKMLRREQQEKKIAPTPHKPKKI